MTRRVTCGPWVAVRRLPLVYHCCLRDDCTISCVLTYCLVTCVAISFRFVSCLPVLYEMATLRKPFDASNMPAIIFSIMRNKVRVMCFAFGFCFACAQPHSPLTHHATLTTPPHTQPRPIPSHFSQNLRNMVTMLLQPNPADRADMATIAKMPVVELHARKWRATCKRLSKPLPTPNATRTMRPPPTPGGAGGGAGAAPFSRSQSTATKRGAVGRLTDESGGGSNGDLNVMNTMSPRMRKAER